MHQQQQQQHHHIATSWHTWWSSLRRVGPLGSTALLCVTLLLVGHLVTLPTPYDPADLDDGLPATKGCGAFQTARRGRRRTGDGAMTVPVEHQVICSVGFLTATSDEPRLEDPTVFASLLERLRSINGTLILFAASDTVVARLRAALPLPEQRLRVLKLDRESARVKASVSAMAAAHTTGFTGIATWIAAAGASKLQDAPPETKKKKGEANGGVASFESVAVALGIWNTLAEEFLDWSNPDDEVWAKPVVRSAWRRCGWFEYIGSVWDGDGRGVQIPSQKSSIIDPVMTVASFSPSAGGSRGATSSWSFVVSRALVEYHALSRTHLDLSVWCLSNLLQQAGGLGSVQRHPGRVIPACYRAYADGQRTTLVEGLLTADHRPLKPSLIV